MAAASPGDRRYLPTHEWHKLEGDGTVVIGLSAWAVKELTDITYLNFHVRSGPLRAGQALGEIESVKATSELYAGIDGTVLSVNQAVIDKPDIINQDPYGQGWLLKLRPDHPAQLDQLLSAADYDKALHQP